MGEEGGVGVVGGHGVGDRGETRVGVVLGGPVCRWVGVCIAGGEWRWWGEGVVMVTCRYGVCLRVVGVFPTKI